jgi:PAP2 superfamily protein
VVVAALALVAALAGAVALFGLGLTPDRYLLVLLAPAIAMRRARRYLLDFVPFAVLIVLYAESRGIAHLLHAHPFYRPQLDLERFLFAGHVPAVDIQHWLWSGKTEWYDHAIIKVTKLHFIVPPLLGFALWVRRRALFYRFAASMLVLSYAGAVTFLVFPAAPPWAAAQNGLVDPTISKLPIPHAAAAASSLPSTMSSVSVTRLVPSNPYAAVPSLHGGYAFLVFLFVAMLLWRTRWRRLIPIAALYPLLQSFAVVYTANHYVVDLLIGFAYAAGAILAVRWFWRRQGWPE